MDDNSYGGKYKISMVGNKYECIIKGCDRSYNLERSLQNHCIDCHNIRLVITGEYIIAIEKEEQENALICIICYKKSKSSKALRDHYFKIHGLSSKLQDGLISPIMKTSNKLSKIYEPDTGKIQDNTNATKTTTDNMNSNRKRPHATAIHEEESNAKKAMLNPSESGYLQSLDTRSSISNSCEEDTTFSNRFLDGITADDSFVTPIAGNTASINTAFQFSATSQDIDDTELLELARELLQTNNDFKTALSGDASYSATSRDSYLQFSVTPKKV